MFLEETPEQQALRQELRAYFAALMTDEVRAGIGEVGEGGERWRDTVRKIGADGWLGVGWPKEYGGQGRPATDQFIFFVETRKADAPFPFVTVNTVGPTIMRYGTEEQKSYFLPGILAGDINFAIGYTEPEAGTDLASLRTRAVRDGDEWVVNGQKVWTTIAQFAAFGMLLARSNPDVPKHEGLTYFIVEMKTPGIEVCPLRQMTGSSEFNEVFLTDVRIPDANRVGDVGDGWRCARTTLMNERVALAGISLDPVSFSGGVRRDAWQSYLDQIPDRTDRRVRQRLAQLYIESEVKEITAFRANSARMRGQQPGPEGAVNKVFNAEYNQRRSSFAVDVNGMAGIAWASDDTKSQARATTFLRARANTIEGGTSEVLRNQMAERILGLPRDFEADKGVAWAQITHN